MAMTLVHVIPFEVPDCIRIKTHTSGSRQDGMRPAIELKLWEVSVETINEMVEEFRASLLERRAEQYENRSL